MLRGYQRVGFEQSPREAIFVWGGADIGVGITPRCSWNVTLGLRKTKPSGGVAKIHIFFTSHFQDSHLGTIPCFLVQENELWRDSVKLLTETFLGVLLWESIFFQFLGTVNWWLLFVWGGRNLCGKRGMGIWKTLEFWWGFFHFQGPNTSELRFFWDRYDESLQHIEVRIQKRKYGSNQFQSMSVVVVVDVGLSIPCSPLEEYCPDWTSFGHGTWVGDMAILLMSEIWWAPVEFGSLSYYFQGFSTIPSGSPDFFHQRYDESMGVIQGSRSYCYDLNIISDQPTLPPRSKGQGSIRAY